MLLPRELLATRAHGERSVVGMNINCSEGVYMRRLEGVSLPSDFNFGIVCLRKDRGAVLIGKSGIVRSGFLELEHIPV